MYSWTCHTALCAPLNHGSLLCPAPLAAWPAPAGFERSIRDVVSVVHIGEHTLSKRLYEFSSTTASAYTAGARGRLWAACCVCECAFLEMACLLLKAGHAALLPVLPCLSACRHFPTR